MSAAAELLAGELAAFERALEDALAPQADYLTAVERALYRRGRRVRPTLLLLCARIAQPAAAHAGPLPGKVVRAAVSLELLHVATLIHDDVVDDAAVRRGGPSVNAARGRDAALLLGDLQFVQALRCFAAAVDGERDMELVRLVLDAGFDLCRGQLDELAAPSAPGAAPLATAALRERWLRTIDRKTAALFGLACECGALLGGGRRRLAALLGRSGRLLGRAFQAMDDLRDLVEPQASSGKPRGADLAQGRVSLPLILAADELAPDSPARAVLSGERVPAALVADAADEVAATRGFLAAYAQARSYALEAADLLELLPRSPYRRALAALAHDVVDRGFARPPARGGETRWPLPTAATTSSAS